MRSSEKVTLSEGRQIGSTGENREYLFSCQRWNESFGAKDLLIRRFRATGPWAPADVQRMPDGKVRVLTSADLGPAPASAQLVEDETGGLEALAERLEQAGGEDSPINPTTAGWVLGLGRPRTGRAGDVERLVGGYRDHELNPRQRQAVEQALGSDVTFIWGPPGTGKTKVVSCVVEGCYRQGLRVLFVAPTHVAVDQAVERMCDSLAGEEGFDAGLLQRAGKIALPSLAAKYGQQVSPELIERRLATAIDAQITRLTGELDPLRTGIARHEQALAATAEMNRLHQLLLNIDRAAGMEDNAAQVTGKQVQYVRREIDRIGTPSGIFAQRKQAKLQALYTQLAHHEHVFQTHRQNHAAALRDRERFTAEYAEARATVSRLMEEVRPLPPLERLRAEADDLQRELNRLTEERQKLSDAVRSRCRIMATTVSKAVQSRRLMDAIDVVVIDEAGMVNLPSAWCAAGLAGRRVVIAGDFRQLPAVTRGSKDRKASAQEREHSRTWMDRDAFHAAGLVSPTGEAVRNDSRMVALNEQYRMRQAICTLVNEVAYRDAPLLTRRRDTSSLPPSPLIESPLVLVDTSSRVVPGTGSEAHLSNAVHEAVIHELIRGLQYDTVLPARKWTDLPEGERPTDRLAVISPYKRQKNALNASLAYRFGAQYEGLVDTVHRFQGSERPLIIIDTVTGAGPRPGWFYDGVGPSSDTCRLLNVALSRARDHLVVVANVQYMQRALRPDSEAVRMLHHLWRHAQRIPVDELVPVRSAADLGVLDEEELARPAFFPADEVQRAVEWDIARARKSIDIYCAFLNGQAVRYWLRRLKPRIADGVRVTVHTRDHAGTPQADLVRELQAAGCQVAARERMHEKVLILDDTVLWHGSLNLLAHSGSTDLMMRITDPSSCERVRHIVERARMDRPARTPVRRSPGTPASSGEVRPGTVVGERLYLAVPFEEKDEAKRSVRARWDPDRKLWHVDAGTPRERVRRWLPGDD
ncbi:AAA domain-containing protein [Actinomadura sp. SCN-SB]|uniref:AAA domain-containing protein n=1 Tax=Actinomadura sp. SCN-SB TaxID=3373092 RepID=UPI0037539A1E